uniref:Transformer-2 protein homolog beta n=1 Tax=Capra hircus TaxID=9925 RepID=A0A452F696_CAPHI
MDLGNLQVIPLQGLAPRKIPGVPDQSPGPDRNLGLDPEEVLGGIIQGHDLGPGPIEDLVADLTAEIIEDGHSHSHSPMSTRWRHVGNRANPDPNCCLGVFGLSLYTTERDLREMFSKYGPIADVSIVYDQQSRRSRGFAFVYFENVDDAKEAKERANGMELDGCRIRVDFSITKRPHTPTAGIYMGRPTYGSSRRRDYYEEDYDRGYDDRDYYSRSYRGGEEEEEDGELLKTGIRNTEDGHLLPTIVVEDTDHVPDLDHTHSSLLKHEDEDFLKPALELGYC